MTARLALFARRDAARSLAGEVVTIDEPFATSCNAAVAAASCEHMLITAFAPGELFPSLAAHALDRDDALGFVTAWGDLPPGRGTTLQPCNEAMLLGRPLSIDAPTLVRRSAWTAAGGLDESLPGGALVDLCLRLLTTGWRGAALDAPLPDAPCRPDDAAANARAILEKHRHVAERHAEEILVIKERWLRDLAARAAARHKQSLALAREQAELDAEAARLEALLERLRPRR